LVFELVDQVEGVLGGGNGVRAAVGDGDLERRRHRPAGDADEGIISGGGGGVIQGGKRSERGGRADHGPGRPGELGLAEEATAVHGEEESRTIDAE
jgi:hypothetical protein